MAQRQTKPFLASEMPAMGTDAIDESSPEPQRKAIDQNAWPIHANGSSVDSFHGIETPE